MSKTSNKITPYVYENIINVLDSIVYPKEKRNRYWITLRFDIPLDSIIALKIFRKLIHELKRKFKKVGGIYNVEYTENSKTPHFHLILMDYAADESSPKTANEYPDLNNTALVVYLYKEWGKLNKKHLNISLTKVSILIKRFGIDDLGKIDGDLKEYVAKLHQKEIPAALASKVRHLWWGWISEMVVPMESRQPPAPLELELPVLNLPLTSSRPEIVNLPGLDLLSGPKVPKMAVFDESKGVPDDYFDSNEWLIDPPKRQDPKFLEFLARMEESAKSEAKDDWLL